MPRRSTDQISFRYRPEDSDSGVTRATTKQLARFLGVDETQAIHRAVREMALRVLPRYERDDGPLTEEQLAQIRRLAPQDEFRSVRNSLLEEVAAALPASRPPAASRRRGTQADA